MTIIAFLQNQWFRDPERARCIYLRSQVETVGEWRDRCARMNARYLFGGCLTGRRLRDAFGDDLCDRITWENVSPRIGGKAFECFGVDQAHVDACMDHFKPDVVLRFGKVAQGANACNAAFIIDAPHPAARHAGVMDELRASAEALQELIGGPALTK